jgi:hypothetical protein
MNGRKREREEEKERDRARERNRERMKERPRKWSWRNRVATSFEIVSFKSKLVSTKFKSKTEIQN